MVLKSMIVAVALVAVVVGGVVVEVCTDNRTLVIG